MANSWFVKPEVKRIELPEGQWILVKKRLTEGERRHVNKLMLAEVRPDGRMTPNMDMIGGKAEAQVYLVEWSLCDEQGLPVKIDTEARRTDALDSLDPDAFAIISQAIAAHVDAMDAERVKEKNAQAGASASPATSLSVG